MIQKDFILRWAQELAKVIARMLGKDPKESIEIIDEVLNELLKIDTLFLKSLKAEQLIPYLIEDKGLEVPQLDFLADLLAKRGELLYEAGQLVESKDILEKALIIFDHTEKVQEVFSFERVSKLDHFRNLLNQLDDKIK